MSQKTKTYPVLVDGNWFFLITIFICFVMYLVGRTSDTSTTGMFWSIGIIMCIMGLLYLLAQHTIYTLADDRLIISWLTYRQELPYEYINHIQKSSYPSSGKRFGWAARGLSVTYQNGSKLYITPLDRDEFLEDINAILNHLKESR